VLQKSSPLRPSRTRLLRLRQGSTFSGSPSTPG
jgi:hypothetical protein